MEPYKWDNRVRFVVRYMYDTDNNGHLDQNDFDCLALKYTLSEGKGTYKADMHEKYKKVMANLWHEISDLADFDKDGQVSVEEFQRAVKDACMGKKFEEFPPSMRHAIECKFTSADADGDGLLTIEEYRLDCVSRSAFSEIKEIDDCFKKLVNEADQKAGGITKDRYVELYAQFLGSPDVDVPGAYLFGPLQVI